MNSAQPQVTGLASVIPAMRARLSLHVVLFCAMLALGIFARTWEFGTLPAGLNQDEAAGGVDAFTLYHFGVDRNGVSFPVHLVSYGSGQSALDAYLLIPFVAIGGLTTLMVRLPILIMGILSLPLVYLIGKRMHDPGIGLMAMFLLAISPWHILLSRWGHESNLLPFFFASGFLLLLKSADDNRWFIPAMGMMALCLYVYAPAYAAIPIFLAMALPILFFTRSIRPKHLGAGLLVLILIALPMGLFLLVNMQGWDSLHLSRITIPRLPSRPRYEFVSGLFREDFFQSLGYQARSLWNMLWSQTDGNLYNVLEPYGYLYRYTLPLAILGAALLIPRQHVRQNAGRLLLLAWLAAAVILGLLQRVNINRMNLIFMPLILCTAVFLAWIAKRSKLAISLIVVAFLIGFAFFTNAYHSYAYRSALGRAFYAGMLPAVRLASQQGTGPICVTNEINEPQIYVLFSEQLKPSDYLPTVRYVNPRAPFRKTLHLGRYSFGLEACPDDARTIYVLRDETPPRADIGYMRTAFGEFTVYVP